MKYDKSNKTEHDIKKDGLDESLPSGGRTFEQILEDYHVQLEDNRRDESIKLAAEKYASQYAHQQPVQGYSREQVNEAMDKIETMETLENTMKPQYQQPVNDGWVRVDSGELPDYRLVVDVYKSHHNVVEPAARLSTDITGEKWSCEYGHYITHWRLRPEPPKQTV